MPNSQVANPGSRTSAREGRTGTLHEQQTWTVSKTLQSKVSDVPKRQAKVPKVNSESIASRTRARRSHAATELEEVHDAVAGLSPFPTAVRAAGLANQPSPKRVKIEDEREQARHNTPEGPRQLHAAYNDAKIKQEEVEVDLAKQEPEDEDEGDQKDECADLKPKKEETPDADDELPLTAEEQWQLDWEEWVAQNFVDRNPKDIQPDGPSIHRRAGELWNDSISGFI